jgi:hypothetical protein
MIRSALRTNSATFICCVMLEVDSSCRLIGILNGRFYRLEATEMRFLMRQLQAGFCLALVGGTEVLSKQMFCRFHHCHTQRTVCPICLSRHSK